MRAGNWLISPISQDDRKQVDRALALYRQTGKAPVLRCDAKEISAVTQLWQIGIHVTYLDQYDTYTMFGEQMDQIQAQLARLRKQTANLPDDSKLKYFDWVSRHGLLVDF